MRIEDVNRFKGTVKSALQEWGNAKIDEMLPKKAAAKHFIKNGLNNMLSRYDDRLNGWMENLFVFVADENGVIDSDTMVDAIAGIFGEMPRKEYDMGMFHVTAGAGEVLVDFPHNFLTDMLVGDTGRIRLTTDDILEFKNLIV